MNDLRLLKIGDVIYGFVQGGFGCDYYDCMKIEVVGCDWIVVCDVDGDLLFVFGECSLKYLIMVCDMDLCLEVWCLVGKEMLGIGLMILGGW